MTSLIQGVFEADDNKLERIRGLAADVAGDARNIGVVKCSIHFVKHEERSRLVTAWRAISVDRK